MIPGAVVVEIIAENDPATPYYIPGSPFYLVIVDITSQVDPTFIQLVYRGDLTAKARAVARVHPKMPVGYGYSVVALAPYGCNAIDFIGTSNVNIQGSGIFSNSNCTASCPSGAVAVNGNGTINIDGAVTSPGTTCPANGSGVINTTDPIVTGAPQIATLAIPEPVCPPIGDAVGQQLVATKEYTFSPGAHIDPVFHPGNTYTLEPGMHCIYGKFEIHAGSIVNGDGVLIVMVRNGNLTSTGGVINLHAATDGSVEDLEGNNWDGMLVYMPEANDYSISFSPEEGSDLSGTVYAPGKPKTEPKCFFAGSGETSGFNLQWVCWTIGLAGDSDFDINYDESKIYFPPVAIDLVE